MKTKIIPFDLETAKKIQAEEIKGKIIDDFGNEGSIVTLNGSNTLYPIVVIFRFLTGDNIHFIRKNDISTHIKMLIEVPDNEPQFKPFDKVLVRENDASLWRAGFYSHELDGKYCVCGNYYPQCIPYEGNENLLGTTDKPKEE